ncbi:MAG: GFA family protein [Candidatus Phaeomarinobacter sp.]
MVVFADTSAFGHLLPRNFRICAPAACAAGGAGLPRWRGSSFPSPRSNGPVKGGEPHLFQSSEKTQRGSCPSCGSSLCAVDEGYDRISVTVGSLDRPNLVVPDERHSFASARPRWWEPGLKAR